MIRRPPRSTLLPYTTLFRSVFAILSAANHDPDQFPHPDRLNLTRRTSRHLSFGSGPHFCVGAKLARLEGQIAIDRKSTRLNSSHANISYAVFCLKKKEAHSL